MSRGGCEFRDGAIRGGSIRDSSILDPTTWGLFRIRATPAVTNVTYRANALGNLY